jgi:hypothetical protein
MRIRALSLIFTCFLLVVPAVWSQQTKSTVQHGILGFLDPNTGAFHPVPMVTEEDAELPASVTVTGTITVTLTITIKTVGITNVNCSTNVSVLDAQTTTPIFWAETANLAATGTGSTRTCKLTIPYSWSLVTASTDNMSTSYSVFATGTESRSSSRSPLDVRKVPASGATTALTAAVTI